MSGDFVVHSRLKLFAAALALLMLCATLAWHFPLMIWDHFDFVPIYEGWKNGALAQTGFLHIHGGHLHTAAYAVLLLTTWLSHGQTWLDCFASWVFLVGYASVVLMLSLRTLPIEHVNGVPAASLIVFLALYPGHLANLQWGWQVAVFLCLFGSVVAIGFLTAPRITWATNLVALAATGLALLSFATGLALVPIAIVALMARPDLHRRQRLLLVLPWIVVCALAVYSARSTAHLLSHFSIESIEQAWSKLQLVTITVYALNYLGSGIARFAPLFAPVLAALALATGLYASVRLRARAAAWPWIAFLTFGAISAGLTALARFPEGESQAFVSRYISFSSLFWIGWLGLWALYIEGETTLPLRAPVWIAILTALATINAVQLTWETERVSSEMRLLAHTLCISDPKMDDDALGRIYYGGATAARERLQTLHDWNFAPFSACAAQSSAPRPAQ